MRAKVNIRDMIIVQKHKPHGISEFLSLKLYYN